jgi:hypothetical protein
VNVDARASICSTRADAAAQPAARGRRLTRLRRLAPWLVTVAIFAFLFRRYPIEHVVATLSDARWGVYLLLMVPYSLFYLLVDAAVLQRAVCWFLVRVRWVDVLPVRATAYILSLVNTQVGQGGIALYLHRRHGIPFWRVASTMLLLSVVEVYQLAGWSLVGGLASGVLHGRLAFLWWVYAVLAVLLAATLWLFRRPRTGRLASAAVVDAFRRARPWQWAVLALLKSPNLLAAIVVHWLALPLFGLQVPFTVLLTVLPLIFFFAALPIAAAHLGPSQLAWTWFLGTYAAGDRLLAYSLAAHLTFMLMNAAFGVLFLPRAVRELRGADDAR